jgi:hypothetical protein
MDLKDVCIDRLSRLTPRNQQRMADNWNMFDALQLHQLLTSGAPIERAAAAQYSANDIYEAVAEYLDEFALKAAEESTAVPSYYLDPILYKKLEYMAKHGLSFKKGELSI